MLFTGKGDSGTTKFFDSGQSRTSKTSAISEALGALDELNAVIGFVKIRGREERRIAIPLREVQECLFIVQAEVAGADKKILRTTVKGIEKLINTIEKEIPPIKGFSIAGGTELSALLDVARTISRRTERRVIAAIETGRAVSEHSRAYLNRLSSLLFALARLANHLGGIKEETPSYK